MNQNIGGKVVKFLGGSWSQQEVETALVGGGQAKSLITTVADYVRGWLGVFSFQAFSKAEAEAIKRSVAEIDARHLLELDAATTVDECLIISRKDAPGSELRTKAIAKAMSLANNFDEYIQICDYESSGSKTEKAAFAEAVSLATTLDQWRTCCYRTFRGSREQSACIRVIAAILEKEGKD